MKRNTKFPSKIARYAFSLIVVLYPPSLPMKKSTRIHHCSLSRFRSPEMTRSEHRQLLQVTFASRVLNNVRGDERIVYLVSHHASPYRCFPLIHVIRHPGQSGY